MKNDPFKNIKNKLTSCFMKKEKKKLLEMAKCNNIEANILAFSALSLCITGGFFCIAIVFDIFTGLTGIKLINNLQELLLWGGFLNVFPFLFLSKKIKNYIYGDNFLKIIKDNNVEKLAKIFEKNLNKKERKFYEELMDVVYNTKVNMEELNKFNKEISEKINKKELSIILKDIELNEILNKNKSITYGYFFKLIEKIENRLKVEEENSEYKSTLEFQEKIFIKEDEKEQADSELKEKIQAIEH